MGDAEKTLREQVEHWQQVKDEAEANLRVANSVLPALLRSLRAIEPGQSAPDTQPELRSEGAAEEGNTPEVADPRSDPAEVESDEPNVGEVKEIKRADAVRSAVREAVQDLGRQFQQTDIKDALLARGYSVNTSTLRGNLKSMCELRDTLKIVVEGRGRRPTVFSRI